MLDARELHDAARDPHGSAPAAFADVRDRIAVAQAELDRAYAERDELIREARAVGVPVGAVARWLGLSTRRLAKLTHGR